MSPYMAHDLKSASGFAEKASAETQHHISSKVRGHSSVFSLTCCDVVQGVSGYKEDGDSLLARSDEYKFILARF